MAEEDTKVRLYVHEGSLYAARNLLDSRMKPYATVVINCNIPYLTAPLTSLVVTGPAWGEIDGIAFAADGTLSDIDTQTMPFCFSKTVDGHIINLHAKTRNFDLLSATRELPVLLTSISVLILLLLYSILYAFNRQVSKPVETLVKANRFVENGSRGYQITSNAESLEFDALYKHFNSMS